MFGIPYQIFAGSRKPKTPTEQWLAWDGSNNTAKVSLGSTGNGQSQIYITKTTPVDYGYPIYPISYIRGYYQQTPQEELRVHVLYEDGSWTYAENGTKMTTASREPWGNIMPHHDRQMAWALTATVTPNELCAERMTFDGSTPIKPGSHVTLHTGQFGRGLSIDRTENSDKFRVFCFTGDGYVRAWGFDDETGTGTPTFNAGSVATPVDNTIYVGDPVIKCNDNCYYYIYRNGNGQLTAQEVNFDASDVPSFGSSYSFAGDSPYAMWSTSFPNITKGVTCFKENPNNTAIVMLWDVTTSSFTRLDRYEFVGSNVNGQDIRSHRINDELFMCWYKDATTTDVNFNLMRINGNALELVNTVVDNDWQNAGRIDMETVDETTLLVYGTDGSNGNPIRKFIKA